MKIGINGSFARKPDAGMGQVTVNFLKKLIEVADKKDEFYIYLEEDLPKGFELPKNFHKRIIKCFYRRDDLIRKIYWEKFLLPRKAERDGCEVFFSLYQSPTIFKKIPHIMLVHDVITKIFPWYIGNFRKRSYYKQVDKAIKQAQKIMTISEHSRIDINRIYDIEKNKIVINYIDCDPIFKQKVSEKEAEKVLKKHGLENRNYIFYIGGFDMRKNVNGLIRAYGMLWHGYENKKDCPDLVLAGKFNSHLVPLIIDIKKEIEEVRKIYKIPENKFKELGFVEQADLPAIYQGAKVFCFPSLYEGFGLPVLEAFNCGCPVVTSRNSSLKELVNEKNAFIFDLESDKSLADKLKEALKADEKIINKKTEQAQKDAKNFEWGKFTDKTLFELKRLNIQ
jgi:glycosyltransferase involved in cell wall biosynthesis